MKMYNIPKIIKSIYRNYDSETGAIVLGLAGSIVGGVALGVGLPMYLGAEAGEHIKNIFEFNEIIGNSTKALSGVGLTLLIGNKTIPIGLIGGAATGTIIGLTTGQAKESLEKKIFNKE